MRKVVHKDSKGRKSLVALPDNAPDSHARYGQVIGPPDLNSLGLPSDITTRLHNELFNRGLYSYADARKRKADVVAALQAVFAVDATKIVTLYQEWES